MQIKTLFVTFLVTLATAMPSPTEEDSPDITQGPQKNPLASGADDEFHILAQKNWQAAGGCKRDWDEDNRCLSQCVGEANSKRVGWDSMTAVIQGGCVIGWNTCRCICEY